MKLWTALSLFATSLSAAAVHPIARRILDEFPSVSIAGSATFENVQEVAGARVVRGLRARVGAAGPGGRFEATLPLSYEEPFVITSGDQRVVIRAIDANPSGAAAEDGKVFYAAVYASVDAVVVPSAVRSEEFLLIGDARAPRTFAYAIVETRGVDGIAIDGGAVRFRHGSPAAPALQIERPVLIDARGKRSETAAHWTIEDRTLRLTVDPTGLTYPLLLDPTFSTTGNMTTPRGQHSATLLPNGKILLAGGNDSGTILTSADICDPATGTVSGTASLSFARQLHTATLLLNGKVLIAGGVNGAALAPAELYDPSTGSFTSTGSLNTARYNHTATLLNNGMVLIAGGQGASGPLTSAELYDPSTGLFAATGLLATARQSHSASLLRNGKVLIAGGFNSGGAVQSAELYDPAGNTFGTTGNLITARYSHTATMLSSGWVLIAGGFGSSALASAELYDPSGAGTFGATGGMATPRSNHTATLLPSGKVLVTGGLSGTATTSAEIYDPGGTFSATASLAGARYYQTATLVPTGAVIIAGGQAGGGVYLASTERFEPTAGGTAAPATGTLHADRSNSTSTLLPDGKVLIAAGEATATAAEIYDPANGTFTVIASLPNAVYKHTATLLNNGKVLIVGTYSPGVAEQLYDAVAGTFSTTGTIAVQRGYHTATLLANGKVLIAGGIDINQTAAKSSAEIYDPATGSFSATGSMNTARFGHTATLFPNGSVLILGGSSDNGLTYVASAELYDPLAGTFTAIGSLNVPRQFHTATLLPSGKVLITGGHHPPEPLSNLGVTNSVEIWDPASPSVFTSMTALNNVHSGASATSLQTGKVFIAGGEDEAATTAASDIYDAFGATDTTGPAFPGIGEGGEISTFSRATMLTDGRVLVTGAGSYATLFDADAGYADARRPVISTAPSSIVEPATVSLTGVGFRGDSEAAGGSVNNSASNAPVLALERIDNEQVTYVNASAWTDSSFSSATVSGLAGAWYRMRLIVNGVPSLERVVLVTGAPAIANITPNGGPIGGGTAVTITGTNLANAAVTIGGIGVASTATATSVTFTTPAHAAGAVDVTVTSLFGSATATGGFTYYALPTPASFSATATSASQVSLTWSAAAGATGYEVWRSTLNAPYTLAITTSNTAATDSTLFADRTYLYKVRATGAAGALSAFTAIDPATTTVFTDASLTSVTIKALHLAQLRTAVNAMRDAAGLSAYSFTDPTLSAGATVVKATHLTELRSALGEALSTLGLPAVSYTDVAIILQSTTVKAVHLVQLRAATQ